MLLVVVAAIGTRVLGPRISGWRSVPVYTLGALSSMWCIERGLEVLV
jgi:hypothetical protein